MNEWTVKPLKEVTIKIGSGATPTGGESSYKETGISLIRSQNVYDYEFNSNGLAFIDDEQANKLANVEVETGDLLLNITGHSVGRCCIVPNSYLPVRVNQHVAIVRVRKGELDSRYLLYYLNNSRNKTTLLNQAHGGTRKALTKGIIENFEVVLPPLPIQRRIAEILGRLDDKIEVNRRINRTLEAMAQALYRHWFVDFGPFQDGPFVESGLGLIPEGWEVGKLGDIARNVKRNVDPSELPPETPYIGLDDMPKDGIITLDTWGEVGEIVSTKSLMEKGQILFGKLRPYFKKVGVVPVDGVCSTDILVIEPKKDIFYAMVLCLIGTQEFVDYTDSVSSGTRMPRVSWQMMTKYQTIISDVRTAQTFNKLVKPWVEIINQNILETRKLAEIRDYLLPKLLSGEIEVMREMTTDWGKERIKDSSSSVPFLHPLF